MSKTPGRTIDVTIRYQHRSPGHDRDDRFAARFSSHDVPREFVEATPIVPDTVPTEYFLRAVFPGRKVEHVAHPTILGRSRSFGGAPPRVGLLAEISPDPIHGSLFFFALSLAFQRHHPLALSPEVLGYLIHHELAKTVRGNPDSYRHLFTRARDGDTTVIVRDDTLMLGAPSAWERALSQFELAMRDVVPDGIMDAMLPRYSTQTTESRVASLIAFMDAASPFCSYEVHSMCGIPRIRLLGTPDDWRLLLEATRKLAEQFSAHLGEYFRHLLPVLATIAQQSDPATPVDPSFWSSIYKHESRSGGDRVNGWITAFVHHLSASNGVGVMKPGRYVDWRAIEDRDGLSLGALPLHLSSVPFLWRYGDRVLPMNLVAGVLRVDDDEGFVTPRLSFSVLHEATRPPTRVASR